VRSPTTGPFRTARLRSGLRRSRKRHPVTNPALRRPVRPLDDGTTELVSVIEFVLPAGAAIQPVLWLERKLLD
jgi:hypothetical protein